jgi:hypothetical protein
MAPKRLALLLRIWKAPCSYLGLEIGIVTEMLVVAVSYTSRSSAYFSFTSLFIPTFDIIFNMSL